MQDTKHAKSMNGNGHGASDGDGSEEEFTLDKILVQIGQFGRFQQMVFLMIIIPMIFNAIASVAFAFTASSVVHRCNISECDGPASNYYEPWTEWAIPKKRNNVDQCHRYESRIPGNMTSSKDYDEMLCSPESFNRDAVLKCTKNEYIFLNEEITISNEFGIYCSDEWKLSLVGTMNNLGQFVGIPLGGLISDRYGRSKSLALGGLISAILGFIRSFSPNYIFFLTFELLDNIACSTLYSTCFIVGIELVGPKRRVFACTIVTMFYAVGEILLAIFAKYFQNWRTLLRILYLPALVHFLFFWILPESVRWLLSQGEEERATRLLKRAAAMNNRRLSDCALDKLVLANRIKLAKDGSCNENKFPIRIAFKILFWRIANCSFCWIVNTLVYYGLTLNAVLLAGDKYQNFIFSALIEIPGFSLPYLVMNRLGRRYSLFGSMLISGLCCLGTVFIGSDQYYWQLSLYLIGKLTITASFQVLYFFTSEIFPTNVRNSLLSFCSMVGRFGSMLAPQTPLLAKYYKNAPSILFASMAITSACLSLFFPETTNTILPTTVQEADEIGTKIDIKKNSTIAISTQL